MDQFWPVQSEGYYDKSLIPLIYTFYFSFSLNIVSWGNPHRNCNSSVFMEIFLSSFQFNQGRIIKYTPKPPIRIPAPFRNQTAPCWNDDFSRSCFTAAAELPAITMGRQWPMAKRRIKSMPVATCFWTVMMARIGAMNPKVHDPESRP